MRGTMTEPRGRRRWRAQTVAVLVAAAAVVVVLALTLHRDGPAMLPREGLSAVDLRALPPERLLVRCFDRLRWYVALDAARLRNWRAQPDVVRHLLLLSTVETDAGLAAGSSFAGLAAVFDQGAFACTAEELAAAYRAIGAQASAAVVEEAGRAGGDAQKLAACDRRLVAVSGQDATVVRMRAFVLGHAEDLAVYWGRP